MNYVPIYSIESIAPSTVVVKQLGSVVMNLAGDNAVAIALTFTAMQKSSPQRGDDYMAGVLAACVHMILWK
jgi:hypothetical protein